MGFVFLIGNTITFGTAYAQSPYWCISTESQSGCLIISNYDGHGTQYYSSCGSGWNTGGYVQNLPQTGNDGECFDTPQGPWNYA